MTKANIVLFFSVSFSLLVNVSRSIVTLKCIEAVAELMYALLYYYSLSLYSLVVVSVYFHSTLALLITSLEFLHPPPWKTQKLWRWPCPLWSLTRVSPNPIHLLYTYTQSLFLILPLVLFFDVVFPVNPLERPSRKIRQEITLRQTLVIVNARVLHLRKIFQFLFLLPSSSACYFTTPVVSSPTE